MKSVLPIGSVVLLKGASKKVMIIGLKHKQQDSEKVWDYLACLYPEGIVDVNKLYFFDSEQVECLYFIGFQDTEGLLWTQKVKELYEN